MTGPAPRVSIVIPARDEAADLPACLDAVLAQDHPRRDMEVVVGAGGSTDGTADVARRRLADAGLARVVVLDDDPGSTPANLNACLAACRGVIVCRVDARSIVPPEYVRCCVEVLDRQPEVVVVGGAQVAVARDDRPVAVGIARALNNRYGMGLARYRRGAASGPSDTVYLGAFRTSQVRACGGWDERWDTNQDFELNRRLGRQGVVWFDHRLAVGYLPRPTLGALWHQYRRFGRWKARYWTETGDRPRPRQVAILIGPALALVAVPASAVLLGRRRFGALLLAGFGVAVAVEVAGPSGPPARPGGHVASLAASAVVATGWWTGAVGALLRRSVRPSSAVGDADRP